MLNTDNDGLIAYRKKRDREHKIDVMLSEFEELKSDIKNLIGKLSNV